MEHGAGEEESEEAPLMARRGRGHGHGGHGHGGHGHGGHAHEHRGGGRRNPTSPLFSALLPPPPSCGGGDHDAHATHGGGRPLPRRFLLVVLLQAGYVFGLLLVGVRLSSMVAKSEGLHASADLVAYLFALCAETRSRTPRTLRRPFGRHRLRAVGGLMNGMFLLVSSMFLLAETVAAWVEQESVLGEATAPSPSVLWIACFGLLVNVCGTCVLWDRSDLHGHSHAAGGAHGHGRHGVARRGNGGVLTAAGVPEDVNVRGALIHLVVDCFSATVLGVSYWLGNYTALPGRAAADDMGALIIVGMCLAVAVPMVRDTASLLMQRPPRGVAVEALFRDICECHPAVVQVEDLCVWEVVPTTNVVGSVCVIVDRSRGRALWRAAAAAGEAAAAGAASEGAAPGVALLYDKIKSSVRAVLRGHGVTHLTVEIEMDRARG